MNVKQYGEVLADGNLSPAIFTLSCNRSIPRRRLKYEHPNLPGEQPALNNPQTRPIMNSTLKTLFSSVSAPRRPAVRRGVFGLAALTLATLAVPAPAAIDYWDGTGNLWGTASFWSTAAGATTPDPANAPVAGDTAIFNITTVNTAQTVYLDGNQSVSNLTFNSTGTTTLLGGNAGTPTANTLTLGNSTFAHNILTAGASAGAVTIGDLTGGGANMTATLAGATNYVITIPTGRTVSFANGFNFGTGKIQKDSGTGTLILNAAGTGAGLSTVVGGGTYNIIARLDAGTVTLGHPAAFGTGVIDTRNETLQAATDLTGANKILNTFVLATGTTTIGGSTNLELGGQFILNAATGGLAVNNTAATTLSGSLYLSDVATPAHTLTVSGAAGPITISGLIANYNAGAGTASGLIKSGGGTLIVSSANNTYSGGTTIGTSGGAAVVRATATQALGTGTITFDTTGNGSTARLELTNGVSLNNAITMAGRNNTTVAIQSLGGGNTVGGAISLIGGGSDYHIQSDANLLTLGAAGTISITNASTSARTVSLQGAGNGQVLGNIVNNSITAAATTAITKSNTGTWMLSGSNTYSGITTISGGTLVMTSTNALGTNGVAFTGSANATLDIATDGSDYPNPFNAGSSTVFTIASDVKTGTVGINHTLGTVLLGSGATPLQLNIIRGPNVASGSPQITTGPVTLNGGSGGTTIINPTTASISFSSFTASTTSKTLQLDGTNSGNSVLGAISDGGGFVVTLLKTNTSTWTLGGANTFSGSTTVAQGTLALSSGGSLASTNIILGSAGILDVSASSYSLGASQLLSGSGTVAGSFLNTAGSQIFPGGAGTLGTLTFNNNLSLAAGVTNRFDFATGTNDLIVVGGNLNPSVGAVINLASLPPGGLANGTYTLMQVAGSISGSASDMVITGKPSPSRQSFAIVYDTVSSPKRVLLQVTGSPASLTWLGTPGLIWNIVTTANWTNAASLSTDVYFDGDSVTFTALGAANQPVLNTIVQPGQVTFNSASDYLLSGTGSISGNSGLVKNNNNTLTITTTNDYTGVTAFNGGTVSVATVANGGTASPLGAASSAPANRTFNGGKFQYTGDTASTDRGATLNAGGGTLEVTNPATTLTVSGAIIGSSGGALTKTGNGALVLSGANTFNGATIVSAGTVTANGGNALPDTGTVTLADTTGVALNVGAAETIGSLAGGGYNGGVNVTLAGALTLGGDNSTTAFGGNISGAGGLTKRGTGTFTLTNSTSFAGNLFVKAGAVVFDTGSSASPAAYCSIGQDGTDNGTLTLKGGASFTTANDFNLGDLGSSTGTLNIQDSAYLSMPAFYIGSANAAGSSATGIVNQTGGTISQTSTSLGTFVIGGRTSTNGVAIYNLSGGQLTAAAPVRMSSFGSCTFNQSGGTFTSASTQGGINLQRFAGPGGVYNLNGGTAQFWNIAASVLASDPTFRSVFNFNGGTLQPTANNTANYFQGLSRANVRNGGAIIDTVGYNITINQPLLHSDIGGDNATDGGLNKQNSGILTLTATNTYTGPTVVNGGTLTISGTIGAGVVTVNGGAILNGTGVVNGATTVQGGTLAPGVTNGILTISNSLSLAAGSTAQFYFTTTTNSRAVVTGALNLNGSTAVNITYVGAAPAVGTYTLIQYGSLTGSFANLTPPVSPNPRFNFALNNNTSAKTVELIVTGLPAALVWKGDGSFNGWDNAGVYQNWTNPASASLDFFYDSDNVTFNDTGSASPAIYLTTVNSPGILVVNATQDYDFIGSGGIAGAATLIKRGSGTLILETVNSYSGSTVISNGTVQVGNAGTTGSLGTGSVTNNGALVFNRADAITVASVINGSGGLSQIGANNLILTGSNGYTGPTTVSSGFLFPRNATALGTGAAGTTASSGGQLYIDQNLDFPDESLTLGGAALRKGGGGVSTLGGAVTLVANTTLNVDGNATLNLTNATGISGVGFNLELTGGGSSVGTIAGPVALGVGGVNKTGTGAWTLGPVNNYTGLTTISAGALRITGPSLGNPASFTANQITLAGGNLQAITNVAFTDGLAGITLNANGTFIVDAGATLLISNQIAGGYALTKSGAGTLVLSGSNPFSGTLNLDSFINTGNDGALRITTSNAILNVVSPISSRNNNGGISTFQLDGTTGDIGLPQSFAVSCRNSGVAWIQNLAGNNQLTGVIQIYEGGGTLLFQSDAGRLEYANNLQYSGAATAARTYSFLGTGNQLVSGVILNGDNGAIINVTKSGTGTLTLSNANTYVGSTTVSGGTLLIAGSINSTNGVSVTGGALGGNGTINDAVTVSGLGTLSPGTSIGTLTINSNLTLAGTTFIEVNKTAGTRDQVAVLNTVNYGGTLFATNLSGTLTTNDTFTIFSAAARTGTFATITGSPGAGLAWKFNPTNGVLGVTTGLASNPTNITFSVSGNQLTLVWPADHTGWILQSQTNSLNAGLSTNWFDVAGSASSNTNVITINPASPTVFYRLRLP